MPKYLIFILLSALSLGIYDVCKKAAVKDNSVMPALFLSNLSGTVFFLLLAAFQGKFIEYATDFQGAWQFVLIFLKACLVGASWICVYYAMRELPISIASPIRATAPLWTFIGSLVIFHEIPTWIQGIAMLIIFCGYYLFSVIGKMEGIHFGRHRGIRLIMLGTLLGSASALYDKYLLGVVKISRNTLQFYFCTDLVLVLGLAYIIRRFFFKNGRAFEWRLSIAATGILLIVADYFYFYAVSLPDTQIAILSLIRRSSCIITFLIGFSYFKDVNFKVKIVSLLLIFAGVVLLALF